ncbi:MAG: 2-amino-4-hydroxy-6-hydroxymethyldihydropteridine diphosphokinase [Verrucomicrobiota bacterium]
MNGVPQQYILGLGSNLGERAAILGQAIDRLRQLPGTCVLAVSETVDSDPIGYADQSNFLNLCLAISCVLNPDALLARTLEIERQLGRERTSNRNGPRTLDIDLLFYEGGAWDSPTVTLPHPRWFSREFVIFPLRNLLQAPVLAKHPAWASLATEVWSLPVGGQGLRAWQGPTPWIQTP